jgi:DNA-binding protein HU-beta
MNKTEFLSAAVEKSDKLNKTQLTEALNVFEETFVEAIENGEGVQLVGFFGVAPVARAARKGYNPQSGEELEIAPKVGVKMKPGKRLEEAAAKLDYKKFVKQSKKNKK